MALETPQPCSRLKVSLFALVATAIVILLRLLSPSPIGHEDPVLVLTGAIMASAVKLATGGGVRSGLFALAATFVALLAGGLLVDGLGYWGEPINPAEAELEAGLMDLLGGRLSFVLALILAYGLAATPRKGRRC